MSCTGQRETVRTGLPAMVLKIVFIFLVFGGLVWFLWFLFSNGARSRTP